MAIDQQQQQINLTLAEDSAELKTQLLVHSEALNTFEKVLTGLIERLVEQQVLHPEDELIGEFQEAVATLRKQGWAKRRPPRTAGSPSVTCPGCNALLRDVTGKKGERCGWCGHVF